MIFSTQNQLNALVIFVFFGLIAGIVFIFYKLLFLEKYQKKTIKIIINTIFYMFFYIFFDILLIFFNFGLFSISLLLGYLFGFLTIVKLIKNLVVFPEKLWYNTINKIFKNLKVKSKNRREIKHNERAKES